MSWSQETGCIQGNCIYGQGTYIDEDGDKYVGGFKDGKMHGQGTFTFTFINVYHSGVWENGEYIGTKAQVLARESKRIAREKAKKIYDRIYNACLLDKGMSMEVDNIRNSVEDTCESIAEDPSWLERWKYN